MGEAPDVDVSTQTAVLCGSGQPCSSSTALVCGSITGPSGAGARSKQQQCAKRLSLPDVCTSGLIVCAPSGMLVTFAVPCGDRQIGRSGASNMTSILSAKTAWPVHADADLPAVVHELRKLPLASESDDRRRATHATCTPVQMASNTAMPSQQRTPWLRCAGDSTVHLCALCALQQNVSDSR